MIRMNLCVDCFVAMLVLAAAPLLAADRAQPVTLPEELRQRCLEVLRNGVRSGEF
jgi:hypothetical protein